MELEQLIADLQNQGLDSEKILTSLEQMVQEGKLTPEDLEKAKQLLSASQSPEAPNGETPEQEKASAGKLFGLNLI